MASPVSVLAVTRHHRRGRPRFDPLYCATNGCATRLIADVAGRNASCPICGFTRQLRLTE